MKREYHAEFYEWHGGGSSLHNNGAINVLLNDRAGAGWELAFVQRVSIGLLFVFKREECSQK